MNTATMEPQHTSQMDPRALHRVVAILYYGRSGSVFLGSLLDSHPSTVSTPGSYLSGFYEFWADYGHLPAGDLIREFADYYAVFFDATLPCKSPVCGRNAGAELGFTAMGPNRDRRLGIDREMFLRSLRRQLGDTARVERKLFFQSVHVAYHEALGSPARPPEPLVVFPLHSVVMSRASELLADFPDAQLLHIIRHPVQTLGSHFTHYQKGGVMDRWQLEWMLDGILLGGVPMSRAWKDQSMAVRLEDLHTRPRETLERLCCWLGIPWDDILMKSTFDGVQWWNVADTVQISGFSKAVISKKHSGCINAFDRLRLSLLMSDKLRAWNYPAWPRPLVLAVLALFFPLLLFPLKMETMTIKDTIGPLWSDLYWAARGALRLRRVRLPAWWQAVGVWLRIRGILFRACLRQFIFRKDLLRILSPDLRSEHGT